MDKQVLYYFRQEIEKKAFKDVGFGVAGLANAIAKPFKALAPPRTVTTAKKTQMSVPYLKQPRTLTLKKRTDFAPGQFEKYRKMLATPGTKTQLAAQKAQNALATVGTAGIKHNKAITTLSKAGRELVM